MENDEIKSLLEKYWAGETSLLEEAKLHEYFSHLKVEGEGKTFKSLFQYFQDARDITMPSEISIPASTERTLIPQPRRINRWLAAAAAILLLAVAGYFLWPTPNTMTGPTLTLEEERAYEDIVTALTLISEKMNKGMSITTKQLDELGNIEQVLNETEL